MCYGREQYLKSSNCGLLRRTLLLRCYNVQFQIHHLMNDENWRPYSNTMHNSMHNLQWWQIQSQYILYYLQHWYTVNGRSNLYSMNIKYTLHTGNWSWITGCLHTLWHLLVSEVNIFNFSLHYQFQMRIKQISKLTGIIYKGKLKGRWCKLNDLSCRVLCEIVLHIFSLIEDALNFVLIKMF